jgi:fibro-slime domain-containing protein
VIEVLKRSHRVYVFTLCAGLGLLGACAPADDDPDAPFIIVPGNDAAIDAGSGGDLDAGRLACGEPGCACEPGSAPKSCYPEPTYTAGGIKVCAQGTMSCRSGNWSSCESLVQYDLNSVSGLGQARLGQIMSALVTDAATCNPCNPDCFTASTAPVSSDLTATNSSNIDYSPEQGGITLHVLVTGTERGAIGATAICGNGKLENDVLSGGVEECDDGNVRALDGCDSVCRLEKNDPLWFCPTPGSPCQKSVCGNGLREGSEPCDDKNDVIGDGCGRNCVAEPMCVVGGACSSSCGDGIRLPTDTTEQCDDGNPRSQDGCSSTCQVEPGYTCTDIMSALPAYFDLTVTYRDFIARPTNGSTRHPDFEATYSGAVTGLVKDTLVGGKPEYSGLCEYGKPLAAICNGKALMTNATRFAEWYANVDISGIMKRYVSTMRMNKQTSSSSYRNSTFGSQLFPLDATGWPAEKPTTKELLSSGHNFGFTSEIRHWFQFKGGEVLTFSGDDDVWVFIGGKLALDIGGVHSKISRTIRLNSDGTVDCFEGTAPSGAACATARRTLPLTANKVYEMTLFHAERHTTQSNFDLTLGGFVAAKSECVPRCGDGIITSDEFCDDGSALNGQAGQCFTDCSGRASKYVTSASYFRDYTATGTCKIPPERPLWGLLNWVGDATLGGSIAFKLQGAETAAGLSAAPPVTVTLPTNVTSGSFNVHTVLTGAGLQADSPYLRVTAVLTGPTDQKSTPVLRSFDVSHTCVNAQ